MAPEILTVLLRVQAVSQKNIAGAAVGGIFLGSTGIRVRVPVGGEGLHFRRHASVRCISSRVRSLSLINMKTVRVSC